MLGVTGEDTGIFQGPKRSTALTLYPLTFKSTPPPPPRLGSDKHADMNLSITKEPLFSAMVQIRTPARFHCKTVFGPETVGLLVSRPQDRAVNL
jgi:hypothetical protein